MFRNGSDAPSSTFEHVRPYVHRALHDDEVRDNVLRAWRAARNVYAELGGAGGPMRAADKLSHEDKVRDELDTTVQSLSEAIVRMGGGRPRRRGSWGVFLLVVGIAAVLFNPATGPSTRTWLRDNLFGSEEEFDYGTPQY